VSSSDRTVEAVESKDKHTVAGSASPAVEDPDFDERMVEMLDGWDNGSATWVVCVRNRQVVFPGGQRPQHIVICTGENMQETP
jgi:hypothetical protein